MPSTFQPTPECFFISTSEFDYDGGRLGLYNYVYISKPWLGCIYIHCNGSSIGRGQGYIGVIMVYITGFNFINF